MTHTHRNIPDTHILTALRAALLAGEAILEVYTMKDREITTKEDNSPLTLADRRADTIIKEQLEPTDIPVFTEESSSTPYETREKWQEYWLVDPLDGTKEFIKKNDEFTVNIALIRDNRPVFGVIYLPVFRQLYFAMEGKGSYRLDNIDPASFLEEKDLAVITGKAVRLPDAPHNDRLRIVVSRSHLSPETKAFIEETLGPGADYEMISAGSSLKFCRVAEGRAELYPRLAPTMEWDIAAAYIIVTEAGGTVTQPDGSPVLFNKEDLHNPWFVVASRKMSQKIFQK